MLDMTESIAPKSDQLNADDLMTGPRTVTVAEVERRVRRAAASTCTSSSPPAGRWRRQQDRPPRSRRRVGQETAAPTPASASPSTATRPCASAVRRSSGIRVSHMSHIGGKQLQSWRSPVTRGKKAPYVVQPLPDEPAPAGAADRTGAAGEAVRAHGCCRSFVEGGGRRLPLPRRRPSRSPSSKDLSARQRSTRSIERAREHQGRARVQRTTAEADAQEAARRARDRPIPHPAGGQHEHRLDCRCAEHRYEGYSPGDGSW